LDRGEPAQLNIRSFRRHNSLRGAKSASIGTNDRSAIMRPRKKVAGHMKANTSDAYVEDVVPEVGALREVMSDTTVLPFPKPLTKDDARTLEYLIGLYAGVGLAFLVWADDHSARLRIPRIICRNAEGAVL
jgi:hypothetical protein